MPPKASKQDVIEDIRRVADELGRPPKRDEYRERGQWSARTAANRFDGSFTTARAAALDMPDERQPEIARAELLADIERVGETVGGEPSRTEYNELGKHGTSTIEYRFESWVAAKKEAGVYDGLDESPSKAVLLADLQRVDETVDGPVSQVAYRKNGEWSSRTVKRWFDSWESACQKAGVTRPDMGPQSVSDDVLMEDIQRVAEALGHVPSRSEYNESGRFTRGLAKERFGSWPDAVEAAGLDALEPGGPPGVHNGHWADIEPYYGPNWSERAAEIRDRDGQCLHCGMSNEAHVEEYGSQLNIHHIVKAREFSNYEVANACENLVALCNSCHKRYEHLPNERAKKLLD